jgi:hypothetical protein
LALLYRRNPHRRHAVDAFLRSGNSEFSIVSRIFMGNDKITKFTVIALLGDGCVQTGHERGRYAIHKFLQDGDVDFRELLCHDAFTIFAWICPGRVELIRTPTHDG